MVTIAKVVEKYIDEHPFIQESLSRGIINHAALANELIPIVNKELKKEIKFSAVNMVIRRSVETLKNKPFNYNKGFDVDSDVTLKTDLIEITLYREENTQHKLKSLYDIVDLRAGDTLTITQGFHEIMLITNKKYEKRVVEFFFHSSVKKVIKSICSLTITLPISAVNTLGLFYLATRTLNWNNINIIDIVSTLTEMTFIINEDDAEKAFRAIHALIKEDNS